MTVKSNVAIHWISCTIPYNSKQAEIYSMNKLNRNANKLTKNIPFKQIQFLWDFFKTQELQNTFQQRPKRLFLGTSRDCKCVWRFPQNMKSWQLNDSALGQRGSAMTTTPEGRKESFKKLVGLSGFSSPEYSSF